MMRVRTFPIRSLAANLFRAHGPAGRLLLGRASAVVGLLLTAAGASAQQTVIPSTQHWVATWSVSPQTQEVYLGITPAAALSLSNVTLRQIVHTSIGGSRARVRFSNAFGSESMVIGAASVGVRGTDAQVVDGSHALTFGGRASITIPPGALVVSDPVTMEVPALGDLAVSLYLPDPTLTSTMHSEAKQTNYAAQGNQTAASDLTGPLPYDTYYFLTNVEVQADSKVGAIVCIGDSITDGAGSTADANGRWPNYFAQRLLGTANGTRAAGVLDQGITGNRLYHTGYGPALPSRFDRDVLAQAGVTHVIMNIGINDIRLSYATPGEAVTADDITSAYHQIITRAHDAGLKIYGGTLMPFGGVNARFYSAAGEATRQAANNFIRNNGEFDGVIDFDAALRDPANPTQLLPQYDCGDHLHLNDDGYALMAKTVKLRFFKRAN